jgi:pimeloyl-ACP methyl ester carboxylesterase
MTQQLSTAATPFTIAVPDEAIEDLRRRLGNARIASDFNNADWQYGVERSYVVDLMEYWRDGFDWRAQEAQMNALPNYRVTIDDVPIHFIKVEGKGPNPIPIVLSHGWPWTFWDYHKVIGPLADPVAYGGNAEDAFDVIVPSLPGFGFSSPINRTVIPRQMAGLWVRLMTEVLGYDRFAASGGDMGAFVSAYLAHEHAERLIGAHLAFPALLAASTAAHDPADNPDPVEREIHEAVLKRRHTIRAHVAVHANDPQTIGYALNDSPLGLAAWIVERRRNFAADGDIESRYTKDDLLTLCSIYWFTGTINTSMRVYRDMIARSPLTGELDGSAPYPLAHDRMPVLEAPTSVSVFPGDIGFAPRSAYEKYTNLHRYTIQPKGGHFAVFEEPELYLADVRAAFRDLRP